jgi:hypothetical protein
MVHEQIPILHQPLKGRRPFLWRDVAPLKRLEFAAQRAELFPEEHVFGPEMRKLFCAGHKYRSSEPCRAKTIRGFPHIHSQHGWSVPHT